MTVSKGAAMPTIVTDDGVRLHAEEAGQGEPLLFIHEFAGDHCSRDSAAGRHVAGPLVDAQLAGRLRTCGRCRTMTSWISWSSSWRALVRGTSTWAPGITGMYGWTLMRCS